MKFSLSLNQNQTTSHSIRPISDRHLLSGRGSDSGRLSLLTTIDQYHGFPYPFFPTCCLRKGESSIPYWTRSLHLTSLWQDDFALEKNPFLGIRINPSLIRISTGIAAIGIQSSSGILSALRASVSHESSVIDDEECVKLSILPLYNLRASNYNRIQFLTLCKPFKKVIPELAICCTASLSEVSRSRDGFCTACKSSWTIFVFYDLESCNCHRTTLPARGA